MSWLGVSYPYRYKVIVNLKGQGGTFRGILWSQQNGWLILKHVELLKDRQVPIPVDGDVLIDRREVEFIQVPPGVQEP